MKKRTRTAFSLFLLLSLVIGLFPAFALSTAAQTVTYGDFEVDTDHRQITKYLGSEAEVVVPKKIDKWNIQSISDDAFHGNVTVKQVTFEGRIEGGWNQTFAGCTSLESVEVPDGITTLTGTFSGCTSLKNVIFTGVPSYIHKDTFAGCTSLSDIELPSSVKYLEGDAFAGCTALTSITLPLSVETIHLNPFTGCTSLKEINITNLSKFYTSVDGVLYTKNKRTLIAYPAGKSSYYTIPSDVNTISMYAFKNNTVLTCVNIPSSVTKIDIGAFVGCSSLKSITIPKNVSMQTGVFSGCTSLEKVIYAEGTKSIWSDCFEGCPSLSIVELPASIRDIPSDAFSKTPSMKTIRYAGSKEDWKKNVLVQCDLSEIEIVFNYVPKKIGDINGGGEVNSRDGSLLNRHLAKWAVQIDEETADINGDGEVNSADGALLARYLAKWDIAYFA